MKYRFFIIALAILLIAAAVIAFSSIKREKNVPAAVATFYYYPKPNVYYNPQAHDYTYWDAGHTTWLTAKALPDSLVTALGEKVVLENADTPVWMNNEKHRMLYAVSLYASPSDFKPKPAPVKIEKPKAVIEKKDSTASPHESGLKRFFKKLFKGKKKSED